MAVFVALYRGVNVGGKHAVKMDALRALHERLGHRDVRTYIQSGNLVFSARGSTAAIAARTAARFAEEFRFAATIVVVDADRWRALVAANPYARQAAANPKAVHVGICQGRPSAPGLRALLAKTGGPEAFTIREDVVYLHAPDGLGTSKFAAGMERAGGVPMTVRNWRTVESLSKLVDEG